MFFLAPLLPLLFALFPPWPRGAALAALALWALLGPLGRFGYLERAWGARFFQFLTFRVGSGVPDFFDFTDFTVRPSSVWFLECSELSGA